MADYCTAAEVKEAMPDITWGATYDSLLGKLATRASRLFDRAAKRWPNFFASSVDEVRYFRGSGTTEQWVDELAAIPTKVEVAETGEVDDVTGAGGVYTAWTAEDYYLWPENALLWGMPYRKLVSSLYNRTYFVSGIRTVKITGKFGYSQTVPEDIKQAAVTQVVRWFKRGQQAFQDAGAVTDLGQLRYVQRLDPDIQNVLENYLDLTI